MCGLGAEKNQMGEADGRSISSSSMTLNLSLQLDKNPRDLLQRFMSSTHQSNYRTPDEETEELELNLGLSLSGQFGVERSPKNKLTRSSSVAGLVPLVCQRGEDSPTPPRGSYQPLMRAASLPTETEEERRKRKELQMLRRMAAKKRRLEKQRSWNSKAENGCGGGEEAVATRMACDVATRALRLPSWAQVVLGSGDKGAVMGTSGGSGRAPGLGPQTSQGSAESQGGSSSGLLGYDSRPKRESGSCSCSRARSPVNCQLLQDRENNNEPVDCSGARKKESTAWASRPDTESPSKKPEPVENRGKEIGINAMKDMPCVFTEGDGPNGRRIEGILYKYGKGEEVRIICVCHGSFLSPAEFVKHAGSSDVAHPLRHIVINPNPSFMR